MPRVAFTSHLRKVAPTGTVEVAGSDLGTALEPIFIQFPKLRLYVVDEQNRLRRHVVIFLNGVRLTAADWPHHPVGEVDEIYVLQALSGG
ncbi:MAG: MoaD/ThiS family protein [Rhodospirillaceae bacterium]|nr:MoaD/ThiS family protein [Rhodospirillaceae bacterium]